MKRVTFSLELDHATVFFKISFLVRYLMANSLLCYVNNMVATHMAENCTFLGAIFVFLGLVPGLTCLRHFTHIDHKQLSLALKISIHSKVEQTNFTLLDKIRK